MMRDISFFDKLKVLVDVSSSSGLCIASIFIIIFLGILMITTNKKNARNTKWFYLTFYLALIIVMFISYASSLSSMFDYMMNNFFIVVYFPNLAIYLAAIISTNIILWKTVFNFNEDKLLKIVNTVIYCIIHYLLVLILNVVTSNKLDVFDKTSVYGNESAFALIGLSSTIFMVWIIFMIIYKFIRSKQKGTKQSSEIQYVEVPRLPANILEKAYPEVVQKNKLPDVLPLDIYEKNIALQKEYEKNKLLTEEYEKMLTLDDYKQILDLLKNKDIEQSPSIVEVSSNDFDDVLIEEDYQENENQPIITNNYIVEEETPTEVSQPILDQLLNLYKSV